MKEIGKERKRIRERGSVRYLRKGKGKRGLPVRRARGIYEEYQLGVCRGMRGGLDWRD